MDKVPKSSTQQDGAMTPADLVQIFQSPDFQTTYRETLNRCAAGERITMAEFAAAIGMGWNDFVLLHSALFVLAGRAPVIFDEDDAPMLLLRQAPPVMS